MFFFSGSHIEKFLFFFSFIIYDGSSLHQSLFLSLWIYIYKGNKLHYWFLYLYILAGKRAKVNFIAKCLFLFCFLSFLSNLDGLYIYIYIYFPLSPLLDLLYSIMLCWYLVPRTNPKSWKEANNMFCVGVCKTSLIIIYLLLLTWLCFLISPPRPPPPSPPFMIFKIWPKEITANKQFINNLDAKIKLRKNLPFVPTASTFNPVPHTRHLFSVF